MTVAYFGTELGVRIVLTGKTLADILSRELAHVASVLAVEVLSVWVFLTCLADFRFQIRIRAYVVETRKHVSRILPYPNGIGWGQEWNIL